MRNDVKPFGAKREIGFEQAFELQERLVIEGDEVDVGPGDPGFGEAIAHRVRRERGIVLPAREAFLLRSRNDFPIAHDCRGTVVIERRNAETTVMRQLFGA